VQRVHGRSHRGVGAILGGEPRCALRDGCGAGGETRCALRDGGGALVRRAGRLCATTGRGVCWMAAARGTSGDQRWLRAMCVVV
jgi:hypothetical protein